MQLYDRASGYSDLNLSVFSSPRLHHPHSPLSLKSPLLQVPHRRRVMSSKPTRKAPSDEEMAPPVYEEGSNIGPNISQSLDCEHLDADLYRSNQPLWKPTRARGVFGGQVIGQAVTVSNRSVREGVQLHSLHCYFLLAGDEKIPIYYHVSRLRDGGSYVTRLVEAKQKGRCIFVLFTSYAKPEPERPRFAIPLPAAINHVVGSGAGGGINPEDSRPASLSSSHSTPPGTSSTSSSSGASPSSSSSSSSFTPSSSGVHSTGTSIDSRFSKERATSGTVQGLIPYEKAELNEERYIRVLRDLDSVLPKRVKESLNEWIKDRTESAIEIRDALPGMYDENGFPTPGYEQAYWLKAKLPVAGGEDAQKAALSYASDMNLLGTVSKALGNTRKIQMMASLDHSMWFYEPFDMNDPLLFFMQTQVSTNGRGLAMGRFYSQDGKLLAVVSQEGVVRARTEENSEKLNKASKM